MALEARVVRLDEDESLELADVRRRFWASAFLTVPVVVRGGWPFLRISIALRPHLSRARKSCVRRQRRRPRWLSHP
jgi:hypothetical protein